jgi:hypothetical protein
LEHERRDWALPIDKGVTTNGFPKGLSSVPVKVGFNDGSSCEVDLVAGFFAVEQDPADLALSPVIGWSVAEPPPKTTVQPERAVNRKFEKMFKPPSADA